MMMMMVTFNRYQAFLNTISPQLNADAFCENQS